MKKYRVNLLGFEITRRCNKKCEHCVRGDAQDVTMSETVIDRVFEDIEDVMHVCIGNGEALLEIDRVEYLFQKLSESSWSTRNVEITTNGTICNKKIIDLFEAFCMSRNDSFARMRISNDEFHSREEYERAFAYYEPLVDMANKRIGRRGIRLEYTRKNQDGSLKLHYDGRAVGYIDVHSDRYSNGENMAYPATFKHRIKIVNDTVPCALQILADGNVTFMEEVSYENLEAMAFGSIQDVRLFDLINRHNENCLLLCAEVDKMRFEKYKQYMQLDRNVVNVAEICCMVNRRILELRYQARNTYPNVPAQEIITMLPFPDINAMAELIDSMYRMCPLFTEDMVRARNKYAGTHKAIIYDDAICRIILFHLNDKKVARKYPYELFEDEKDAQEFLSWKFEDLDARYEADPGEASNTANYPCSEGVTLAEDIDYSAEKDPQMVWEEYKEVITSHFAT